MIIILFITILLITTTAIIVKHIQYSTVLYCSYNTLLYWTVDRKIRNRHNDMEHGNMVGLVANRWCRQEVSRNCTNDNLNEVVRIRGPMEGPQSAEVVGEMQI